MSKIISIGTAVPCFCHQQQDILQFMQMVYAGGEADKRKLKFLYQQSGIRQRYSVIPDYSLPAKEWKFFCQSENLEPFPCLEKRMMVYQRQAPHLSVEAINYCIKDVCQPSDITHLITVSCTGMSAPGLDLQIMELMGLPKNIFRTSVNFMGCYAAVHALKLADFICKTDQHARALIICTELCTIHFQREPTMDNIASSLLFGDGAAAALVTADREKKDGIHINGFHSEVLFKGKADMAWELSSKGFLMTLSGYIPDLIEEDLSGIIGRTLHQYQLSINDITAWCMHPGGKRILQAIENSIGLTHHQLQPSYDVLEHYGNMSSATILFVLKSILDTKADYKNVLGAAFGPGLTVETFLASS